MTQQRGGEVLLQRKIELEVVDGPDQGKRAALTDERLSIGSHPQSDLALSDETVSRQHAELRLSPKGVLVVDLDSTNGTAVGGVRVREAFVPEQGELRVGKTRIRLRVSDETVSHPLFGETRFGSMIGNSPLMRALFSKLERVGKTDATVLLNGESGTGKELAARAVHDASARAEGPFVVVDCGALPSTLIESELFGHEKGAFTGAAHSRQGAFEQADGGTLFLDEIGELELELQPRLLRALESREVRRLGANRTRPVNIRVVAATNRDLGRRVAEGAFREDLYYRLAVVQLTMPSLRDRREDIPLLVRYFIEQLGSGDAALSVSDAMLSALAARPWPGNVRELRNVVERAIALGDEDVVAHGVAAAAASAAAGATTPATSGETSGSNDNDAGALIPTLRELPYKIARAQLLEAFERDYLAALLERREGNLTQSAREAEIDRVYLLRLLDKYDMRKK
ncbi:MAG: sigma 54-dependent Fis family transcriptional regulator [Myxococcales bacterium]|nr:sigma 54-dependent Fis family transcriptional regulator [Myxococcales bacterium]